MVSRPIIKIYIIVSLHINLIVTSVNILKKLISPYIAHIALVKTSSLIQNMIHTYSRWY